MADRDPPVLGEIINEGAVQASGTSTLLAFVDPLMYGTAYELSGWSIDEEVATLVKMARNEDSPRTQIQAIRTLRKNAVDALLLSGTISKASVTSTQDGTTATFMTSRVARAAQIASSNRLLPTPQPDPTPQQEPQDATEEDGPRSAATPGQDGQENQALQEAYGGEESVDPGEAPDHIHKPPEAAVPEDGDPRTRPERPPEAESVAGRRGPLGPEPSSGTAFNNQEVADSERNPGNTGIAGLQDSSPDSQSGPRTHPAAPEAVTGPSPTVPVGRSGRCGDTGGFIAVPEVPQESPGTPVRTPRMDD